MHNQVEIAKILLEHGASPVTKDPLGVFSSFIQLVFTWQRRLILWNWFDCSEKWGLPI